jgi:hypothetical protein
VQEAVVEHLGQQQPVDRELRRRRAAVAAVMDRSALSDSAP